MNYENHRQLRRNEYESDSQFQSIYSDVSDLLDRRSVTLNKFANFIAGIEVAIESKLNDHLQEHCNSFDLSQWRLSGKVSDVAYYANLLCEFEKTFPTIMHREANHRFRHCEQTLHPNQKRTQSLYPDSLFSHFMKTPEASCMWQLSYHVDNGSALTSRVCLTLGFLSTGDKCISKRLKNSDLEQIVAPWRDWENHNNSTAFVSNLSLTSM